MKKAWRASKVKGRPNMYKMFSFRDEIKSLNDMSYCFKCDLVKEPRVHHCRICKKCIQRMDHHCPWVGNCVGKLNHKYFILFLFYATVPNYALRPVYLQLPFPSQSTGLQTKNMPDSSPTVNTTPTTSPASPRTC